MSNETVAKPPISSIRKANQKESTSNFATDFRDFMIKTDLMTSVTYFNMIMIYIAIVVIIGGGTPSYWWILVYLPVFYIITVWRKALKENLRLKIAHRMPFFADALANSLSVGANLEHAFNQATYYLKDEFKSQFDKLILKCSLGKDLGELLRRIDADFPGTGLRYLISLIDEYRELGVGISPLLKRMADALTAREEAEERIRTVLASGSSYARLSIMVFGSIFAALSYVMRDQIVVLLGPSLRPTFLFLCCWTFTGILVVTRLTAMDFAKIRALRPSITAFMDNKEWTMDSLMEYSGVKWPKGSKYFLLYTPLIVAFCLSYIISWYNNTPLIIGIGFIVSAMICKILLEYILKGMVEDELIDVIETFPEVLQVFIIGLNSGLNTYLSFQLAQNAVKGIAPRLLVQELARVSFAMQCGESSARTWQKLADTLPFETVIDFCEIMVVAPMHGESIVKSIIQMNNGYQVKKLTFVEKKAQNLGQMVIPIIVLAFFPLFLFAIFAPLLSQMGTVFSNG